MSATLPANDLVYLRPEVKLEPLVYKFYAWSHLIAPAQAALNFAQRILPLLANFAENPGVHIAANEDPRMYGGPFVALSQDQVPAVHRLVETIQADGDGLLAFARVLRDFEALLQERAVGFSMSALYDELPAQLRGLVECVYDERHRPGLRLLESLIRLEPLAPAAQEIQLSLVPEHAREFFMTTPRLPTADTIDLPLRFDDPRIDDLARMRTEPRSLREIAALLDVPDDRLDSFQRLFATHPPARRADSQPIGDGVRIRYFGHACVLLQTDEVTILIDPMVAMEDTDDGRFSIADLPERIDYVFLTHAHHDHCCPEMLLQLRHRIGRVLVPHNRYGSIADPSMKLLLQRLGFRDVVAMDPMDRQAVPGGEIVSLPFMGEHADLDIHTKQAALVRLRGRQFGFLVDSDGRDDLVYAHALRDSGPVDALFIGMECQGAPLTWLYEPLLGVPLNRRNNESRRLSGANCDRATALLERFGAPHVFVYALGQERWMKHLMGLQYEPDSIQLVESSRFVEACSRRLPMAERLYGSRELHYGAHS